MKQVIVTIDTEGHDGKDPINNLIWGRTKDENEYGINHIMDICDHFSVKGLFFVDIAEAWDYGKENIIEVIKHIDNRGHDVGVHIHPDHIADRNRLFLWEYTKDEQYDIIKRCTDFYTEILGKPPSAFRAGKYGANYDTLDILSELGYKYDFSHFYCQRWCGINPPITINVPVKYKNIVEIPVTVYESISIGNFKRYDKIDANTNFIEMEYVIRNFGKLSDDSIITLFYHSFSMLNWRDNPDAITLNKKEERKFVKILQCINDSENYRFTSLVEMLTNENALNLAKQDKNSVLKIRNPIISFWFTVIKAYDIRKYNLKAKILLISMLSGCFALLLIITAILL